MVGRYRQEGVAYLWMLFLVFLLGLGLGKELEVYSTLVQREREAELIHVGNQYRTAIRQYYLATPGALKRYPPDLASLLKDPRSPAPRRFLRRLYPDPVSGQPFVILRAPEGGIRGVASPSTQPPLREWLPESVTLAPGASMSSYRDWEFTFAGNH